MLDLNAIEQRANAATPGPWAFAFIGDKSNDCVIGTFFVRRKNKRLEQVGGSASEYIDDGIGDFDEVIASKDNDANVENFAFIAHARTDIPALIARVRELEEALAKCAAHTAYLPGASRELLEGLLTSIRRITGAAKDSPMPTRPPPPPPYEMWLDSVLDGHIPESPYGRARAELAELRAELERLRAFYDSVTSTQSATVPPSTTYTIFGAGDTTGHNPCDPADEYLRTARTA